MHPKAVCELKQCQGAANDPKPTLSERQDTANGARSMEEFWQAIKGQKSPFTQNKPNVVNCVRVALPD